MGTIDGTGHMGRPGLWMPGATGTMARRWCVQGPPDVATSDERKGYR